jgi:outer membrane protein assembly factor BamD (BamD/ComL family)
VKVFRQILLILCALSFCGGAAAASSREERMFTAASSDFKNENWGRAETQFGQFIQRYPNSTNAPMAVLLQAQAQFKQKKYTNTVDTLRRHASLAGGLADQFSLWTGEAQFAGTNYSGSAATFLALVKNFPDSPWRLRATVEAAAAYARLADWRSHDALLEDTNGLFQKMMASDPANELVTEGQLSRENSKYQQTNFAGVAVVYGFLTNEWAALKLDQQFQSSRLFCLALMAGGDFPGAASVATNLVQIARLQKDPVNTAEAFTDLATVLEKRGQTNDAIAAWQENLAVSAPPEKQRQAVLQIAGLYAAQGNYAGADARLDRFLKQSPDAPATDLALLTRGELLLKNYSVTTNADNLVLAHAQFSRLLKIFPNSQFAGRAFLGRGWSASLPENPAAGLDDFQAATQHDLSPVDLAVAKFKTGDALYAQGDYRGALENYSAVSSPDKNLNALAMYQSLRADLELGEVAAAGGLFEELSRTFSDSGLEQGSALLYGQSLVSPADARALFQRLAPKFSGSPLEPELRLAIARTFEQEQNWDAAGTNYENWVRDYPTNSLRAQADFALAQAVFHLGDEARALDLFTAFVAQHPMDTNAPLAQFWIGDHYYRAENFVAAETNYEAVFQNPAWKDSTNVYYEAQLSAGRSAMARTDYKGASQYFTALIADTNGEPGLRDQARFGAGAALMSMDSSDTTNTFINLQSATKLFAQILTENPTNDFAMRAQGEMADCDVLLNDFASATNAYAQVFATNSIADISARSRAQVAFAMTLEKLARQASPVDTNTLQLALDAYLDVFQKNNLRDGETADLFWVKEAGLGAAPLVGTLLDAQRQTNFYRALELELPQLKAAIDKKIAALPKDQN